jgi:Uma2 family endonuclease
MAAPLDIPVGLPEQRRISVAEYHRMVEVGILGEDDRVELLEGVLVAMPPMGEPHSWSTQPDLAVVALRDDDPHTDHPESALLVIEVAVSSLRYDRNAKGPVYARWGIPEYWIVDVDGRAVEVHTDPDRVGARYRSIVRLTERETLKATTVPLPAIAIAAILP